MQTNKNDGVFDDVEIVRLNAAYLAALREIREHREWTREIDVATIRVIVAKTILANARTGMLGNSLLSTLAIAAVQAEFAVRLEAKHPESNTYANLKG